MLVHNYLTDQKLNKNQLVLLLDSEPAAGYKILFKIMFQLVTFHFFLYYSACPPNYYTSGPHSCHPCPRNSITAAGSPGVSVKSCVCAEGYIGIVGEACIGSVFNTLN